ncbi:uncharacterized protein [Antedon mediterranea]|uniref:uncharacterized protein n=1 Tax=Antedon mediterranea TaxID=105859 RepID=UPI003AF907AB
MAHAGCGNGKFSLFAVLLIITIIMSSKARTYAVLDKDTVYESRDSVGRNFIFTFMDNHQTHSSDPYVLITGIAEGYTTVYITSKNHNSTHRIYYRSSIYVDLPNSLVARTADSHDVAVQITSNKEIHVAGIDSDSTTTDAFQALPVDALGNEYYVMSFDAPSYEYSEFAITAVRPSTNVTIKVLRDDLLFKSKTYKKGEVISQILDFKETIQIQSFGDCTGTYILADKPIALQAGTSCAFVPASSSPCDHLVEFIPPVSSYGYEFALAPFLGTQPGYVYRILAAYDNTTFLDSSSDEQVTIHAGEYTDYIVDKLSARWITSSKPILVAQFIKSGKLGSGKGDPAMAIVPAVQQFTGEVFFSTFNGTSSTAFNNYISITAECRYFDKGVLLLSTNSFITRTDFWRQYYFGNGMCCITGSVRKGSYTLRHSDSTAKFLVMTYGINTRVSYLLPSQYAVDRMTYTSDDGEVMIRKPTIEDTILYCQFETSSCEWSLANATGTNWQRACGLLEEGAINVPSNGVGGEECDYYTYIRETGSGTSYSKVRSPDFVPKNDSICISVHFFMSGPSGSMATFLVSENDERQIWTRKDNHGNFWHPVTSTVDGIRSGSSYYIAVEAVTGENFTAAVDGIIVGDGPCGVGAARITTRPVNATTDWHASQEFVCEVYGHPQPAIIWLDGKRQPMQSIDGKFNITSITYLGNFLYRSIFTIKSISTFDNGEYFCQTYNSHRTHIMKDEAAFTLMSYSKARILIPPKSATVFVDVNHTLECSASGGPPPIFKWFIVDGTTIKEIRNNQHIYVEAPEFNRDANAFVSRLRIVGINRADNGQYRCQAKNVVNQIPIERTADCNIYVETIPDPPTNLVATRATPNSIQLSWEIVFTGNLDVTECILTYVDSSKVGFAAHLVHISVDYSKFILNGVDALSEYNISMSCSNRLGTSEPSYASFVSAMSKSASIESITNNAISQAGTTVETFECLVNAAPAPTVTWFKSPLGKSSGKTKITGNSKYTISDVTYRGNMMYACILTLNTVEDDDSMNYYCQASNSRQQTSEKSTSLTVIDKPDAVSSIQTESQSDNSLDISWTPGSSGNLPLETCYVTYIDSNANTFAPDIRYISAKYTKIRISYLRQSAYYNVTIACRNKLGYGPAVSQAFARVDGKPIDRYNAPTTKPSVQTFSIGASVTSLSTTSLLVMWSTTGTTSVKDIDECTVRYKESNTNDSPNQKTIDLQMQMFTIIELTPGTSYDVVVKCTNVQGESTTTEVNTASTMQEDNSSGGNELPKTGSRTKQKDTDDSSNVTGLAIGLGLLTLLVIIILAAVIVKLRKRRPEKKSVDDSGDPLDIFSSSS